MKFLARHRDFPFDEWQRHVAKSRKRADWNGWIELVFHGSLGLLFYHHVYDCVCCFNLLILIPL